MFKHSHTVLLYSGRHANVMQGSLGWWESEDNLINAAQVWYESVWHPIKLCATTRLMQTLNTKTGQRPSLCRPHKRFAHNVCGENDLNLDRSAANFLRFFFSFCLALTFIWPTSQGSLVRFFACSASGRKPPTLSPPQQERALSATKNNGQRTNANFLLPD